MTPRGLAPPCPRATNPLQLDIDEFKLYALREPFLLSLLDGIADNSVASDRMQYTNERSSENSAIMMSPQVSNS